jgi:hypothetical protein
MVRGVGEPAEPDTWKPQPFSVEDWREVRWAGDGYAANVVHLSGGQTVLDKSRAQRRGLRSG